MRENREIPCLPYGGGAKGRAGKVDDRNPAKYGQGKSDNPIVLTKLPNKAGRLAEEVVEGRGLTKENAGQQNTCRTQGRESVSNALERIRQLWRLSKVRAGCASCASPDPYGGPLIRAVPTATKQFQFDGC
jgi:RNA-directed DNA polymerase